VPTGQERVVTADALLAAAATREASTCFRDDTRRRFGSRGSDNRDVVHTRAQHYWMLMIAFGRRLPTACDRQRTCMCRSRRIRSVHCGEDHATCPAPWNVFSSAMAPVNRALFESKFH